MCISDESNYRKIGKAEMEEFVKEKRGSLEKSKALRRKNKDDSLVSYGLISLYPNAEADKNSKWPATETSHLF